MTLCLRQGEGPPVLLVHGLAGSTAWWQRNVPELARHHCVYRLDLPGFGSLRRLASDFSIRSAPDWLARALDQARVKRASLIGHSMGALISALFAARWPERVDRLVLAAPAIGMPQRNVFRVLRPLALTGCFGSPSFLPRLMIDCARAGVTTLYRAGSELLRIDVKEELQQIAAPALVIAGARDRLVPPKVARAVSECIAGSRFVILPRAGHILMYDRPKEFNRCVLEFLQ